MPDDIAPKERLRILRAADRARHWYSLDEKRICGMCGKIISGHEIQIGGSAGNYTLHCPTAGCPAPYNKWRLFRLPPLSEDRPFLFSNDLSFLAGDGLGAAAAFWPDDQATS